MDEYTATEQAFKNGYEKGYAEAMCQVEKAHVENQHLRDELDDKILELKWLYGFKAAIDMVFGGGDV